MQSVVIMYNNQEPQQLANIGNYSDAARARNDKDRTGTITIVPVRTGTVILEKYRKF